MSVRYGKSFGLLLSALILLPALTGCGEEKTLPVAPRETRNILVPRLPDHEAYNIVLILTDDQRWDTMDSLVETNRLLAKQGVVFTHAMASTPLCCPSRASILTGLYAHNHGVISNVPPFGGAPAFHDDQTIGVWLQAAGYRTALIGKYLNSYYTLQPWPYVPPGWSDWHVFTQPGYYDYKLVENGVENSYGNAPEDYSTTVLRDRALTFIDSTPANQPFFLFFAPYAPHDPATPAPGDETRFSSIPAWRPPSYDEADMSDKPAWARGFPRLSQSVKDGIDNFRLRQLRSVMAVDRAVADIVNELERTGRLDRTAIVFASDNGMSWGEHRYRGKNCDWEECIRVPLIIRAPGVAPRVDSGLVLLLDLTPTFASWARTTIPIHINGGSLVHRLAGQTDSWREGSLIEVLYKEPVTHSSDPFNAIRTGRYLYAEYATGERELYDLVDDPYEMTNLSKDPSYAALILVLKGLLNFEVGA